jgi:hypothetical protein
MSWFNWFSSKKTPALANSRGAPSDVLTSQQMDFTRPMTGSKTSHGAAQPAAAASAQRLEQRRTERNTKRELLFHVVCESMLRVGVLSSAFKFKVLSLDQRGRSFLVMIELSAEFSGEVEKLAEIENMIAQTARHRFDIIVQAVYWRYFNGASAAVHAASSAPASLLGAIHAPISRPTPLFSLDSSPSASAPEPSVHASSTAYAETQSNQVVKAASPVSPNITRSFPIIAATASQREAAAKSLPEHNASQDDLGDDEIAAFRRALAAGAAQDAMVINALIPNATSHTIAQVASQMPASTIMPATKSLGLSTLDKARSKLLLTGYEDTEITDDDPLPALSGTQYGELR